MSDFKEGGCYCIKMLEFYGIEIFLIGEYVIVLVNEKFVFFWVWEDNLEDLVMIVVDVYFEVVNDG